MSSPPEDRPLLQDGVANAHQRPTWISLVLFLVLQFLIFIPEGMMETLGVQFARSTFARERNFTLPVGVDGCASTNQSNLLDEIQAETAVFAAYQSALTEFIPVLTSLPLTAVSDFTGRRPILLLRCLGSLTMAASFLIVSFFGFSAYFALIGCAVFGISGGYVLLSSASMLYVTNLVAPNWRGVALAAIYAVQNTLLHLSPLIINILLQATSSFTIVYLITTCFALMACVWMLPPGLIRESVDKQPLRLRVGVDMIHSIRRLFANALNGKRWRILVLLASDALKNLQVEGFQTTINLYGLGRPFCWTPTLVGVFSALWGIPNALVAPLVVWFIGLFVSDYWVLYLSISSGILQCLLTAVATTNAQLIYGVSLAGIFFGISQPVYITLLTKLVDKNNHGTMFSLFSVIQAFTLASSTIIQSSVYSIAVRSGHAIIMFYVMAVLCGSVFIPTIVMHVLEPKDGFDGPGYGCINNGNRQCDSSEESE